MTESINPINHINPIELYYYNLTHQIEDKLVTKLRQFIIDLNEQEPELVKIIAKFVWGSSKSWRLYVSLIMNKCKLDKRPLKCLQLLSPREWACYLDIRFHTNYLESLTTTFITRFVEVIASRRICDFKITKIIRKVATDIGFPEPNIFAEYIYFKITNDIFFGRGWYIKEVNGNVTTKNSQTPPTISSKIFLESIHTYVFQWFQIFQEILKVDIINMKNKHKKQNRRLRGVLHLKYSKICDRTIKMCMDALNYEIKR